jgi:hypothetical protein
VGFFVYRHLGLLGCNIAIMKRFLPLLILTGLLFGQDILNLKNGESYKGIFFGKVGEDIVFKVQGETSTKKYSINDVNTIVTKNGELTYPFDIPTKDDVPIKKENPSFGQDVLYLKSGEYKNGVFIEKLGNDIVFQIEGENIYNKFSIDKVEIIETNQRKYYYPFDVPISQPKYKYQGLSPVEKEILKGCFGVTATVAGTFLLISYITIWLLILIIEEGFTG